MPTLLPIPPPVPFGSAQGSAFEDYCRLFALDANDLKGRCVLEVAAGYSSFTAEACRRGVDAVAVDPSYHASALGLADTVRRDLERADADGGASTAGPVGAATRQEKSSAAHRFLADFEAHARRGRYLRGSLPALPFLDGAFDFVVCTRLFQARTESPDLAPALDGCLELLRVSTGDVRIFAGSSRVHPDANRLRRALTERNLPSRLQSCGAVKILIVGRGADRSSMAA